MKEQETNNELLQDAVISSDATGSQMMPGGSTDGQQIQILEQFKHVTERLDHVEDRMVALSRHFTLSHELSTDSFLESVKSSKSKIDR